MMCENCGLHQASIHLTTIVNGEKQEKNLCPDCLAKLQKGVSMIDIQGLTGMLSGFLNAAKAGGQKPETPNIKCEHCGMTYETFQKIGLLGCANCYQAFRDPLSALLTRVHGHIQHVGRVPAGADEAVSIRYSVDQLRKELKDAIAAEEYETAAGLRDQIRGLSAQLAESAPADEAPPAAEPAPAKEDSL